MRIADNMSYEQVRSNLQKNRSEMSELQNQAATQKRVTKPSDDPLAASRVLGGRVEVAGQDQYLKNVSYARSFLEYADQSLGDLSEMLVRAKELALGQANDASSNEQSRRAVATEIAQLFNQSVAIGNRKLGDRFLFGGFKTTQSPFDHNGDYRGDEGEILIQVNKEAFVNMNIPGNRVFLGEMLSRDGMVHGSTQMPKTIEEFQAQQLENNQKLAPAPQIEGETAQVRGPAGQPASATDEGVEAGPTQFGTNVFKVLKNLEISLTTDDKMGVQEALDDLDKAISQVILARSQVGSRVMALDSNGDSLQKARVDVKATISNLEDADVLTVVSDISKNEATLKAALETSGKLIQPSLLDFLR